MPPKADIRHDPIAQKFTLQMEGTEAVLEYHLINVRNQEQTQTVNFTHTFVPPQLRGQGLAESLVRHGLKWAKENDYDIRASCWYVNKFLR